MVRRSLIAGASLVAALATSATANPSPVYPEMHFDAVTTLRDSRGKITAYQLCAHGDASFLYVFGAWDYRIDGTRASTSGATGPVIDEHASRAGSPTFGACLTVARFGYASGHAHATFSYDGVGGDIPYTIEHTFTWCDGCPNAGAALDEIVHLELDDLQTEVDPL